MRVTGHLGHHDWSLSSASLNKPQERHTISLCSLDSIEMHTGKSWQRFAALSLSVSLSLLTSLSVPLSSLPLSIDSVDNLDSPVKSSSSWPQTFCSCAHAYSIFLSSPQALSPLSPSIPPPPTCYHCCIGMETFE